MEYNKCEGTILFIGIVEWKTGGESSNPIAPSKQAVHDDTTFDHNLFARNWRILSEEQHYCQPRTNMIFSDEVGQRWLIVTNGVDNGDQQQPEQPTATFIVVTSPDYQPYRAVELMDYLSNKLYVAHREQQLAQEKAKQCKKPWFPRLRPKKTANDQDDVSLETRQQEDLHELLSLFNDMDAMSAIGKKHNRQEKERKKIIELRQQLEDVTAQMNENILALVDNMELSEEQLVKKSRDALEMAKVFRKKTALLRKETGGWGRWRYALVPVGALGGLYFGVPPGGGEFIVQVIEITGGAAIGQLLRTLSNSITIEFWENRFVRWGAPTRI